MDKKDIKFFVKRIFTKDLSLESPEAPAIFDNIKATPKVAFNLNTTIATVDDTTYDITLDINVKAETENNVIYLLGIVNEKEADEAIKIAKSSKGVNLVVPLFELNENVKNSYWL